MRLIFLSLVFFVSSSLAGCAGVMKGEVYRIGSDTYTVTNRYGRAYALKDANSHCQEMNLYLKIIKERSLTDYSGTPDSVIDFKCLAENSEEYKNSDYEVESDVTIKSESKISIE
ncbi:MAG: hypothetical protein RI567_00990 [Marinobacter sp.]|nr:hypothetical protein [Marinobacter sp.]